MADDSLVLSANARTRPRVLGLLIASVLVSMTNASAQQNAWVLVSPPFLNNPPALQVRPGTAVETHIALTAEGWLDTAAPLTKWQHVKSFDTAKECEDMRSKALLRRDELIREWTAVANQDRWLADNRAPVADTARIFAGRCLPASVVYPR